jgi:hypothetical protein
VADAQEHQGVDLFDESFGNRPTCRYNIEQQLDGVGMIACIKKILQPLAFDGDTLLQEKQCIGE